MCSFSIFFSAFCSGVMYFLVSETERAKRFAKIRLSGTAFNRRLNCTIVVRTVPNLSVENAQRKHVRSCVIRNQSKANRKSSPENCLWSISIAHIHSNGSRSFMLCCVVCSFSRFFPLCVNHCNDCFKRNSKRRQMGKNSKRQNRYRKKKHNTHRTTQQSEDQSEHIIQRTYTVNFRKMNRSSLVSQAKNADVLVARTVSCAWYARKGNHSSVSHLRTRCFNEITFHSFLHSTHIAEPYK